MSPLPPLLSGDENPLSQLPQKAGNGAQTPRSLRIRERGNNKGIALYYHISTSSSHQLMAKPLSLPFPSSLLSFFTLPSHSHRFLTLAQCPKDSLYHIFLVYHQKAARSWEEDKLSLREQHRECSDSLLMRCCNIDWIWSIHFRRLFTCSLRMFSAKIHRYWSFIFCRCLWKTFLQGGLFDYSLINGYTILL